MPSIQPDSALGRSLTKYFDNELYSDLRIKDRNGYEYAVHRVIVCGQSPFFANALKPEHGFKESQTGVINLEQDDPDAVRAMLEFMYRGTYTITDDDNAMTQLAHAYALGEMYDMRELKDLVSARFKEVSAYSWMEADFANAVRVIYESIPDTDTGFIREVIIKVIAKNYMDLITNPEFEAVLVDFGVLGKDVLRIMGIEARWKRRYQD